MADKSVDVLVVGSGAGAAPAAFKLATAGMNVLVLEKGDFCERNEVVEDELLQIHQEMYRPSGELDPTVVKSDGKVVAESSRVGQSFYLVGGGTVRYSGTSWRFRKQDFSKVTSYGAVPGTSLVDWPLTYEELEPYYTEAELEIGISGKSGVDPTEPARSKDVLLPPLGEDKFQRRISNAASKLGWKPFPIPIAIHSVANERTGGSMCTQCGWCSGYPCLFQAKSAVDIVIYPRAKKTGHFNLRTHSYVTQLFVDKKGRVSGAEVLDLKTQKRSKIQCKVLVLAASALQSARLLLLSKSGKYPKGLSNSSGLLGKNLMFHIEAKAGAVFDEDFNQGLYKKMGVHDFYFPKKDVGFINHVSIQSGSKATPIAFALQVKGFGTDYTKELRENFLRTHELQVMAEDMPQETNTVSLSSTKKDPWGIPAPEVTHKYHDNDRAAVTYGLERIRELLTAAGGKGVKVPKDIQKNITGRYTWHLMGTARMGKDPQTSVLNPFCQSHDIKNLFITDGSAFPTSGGLNPTLTMQALSFRTADYILKNRREIGA